MSTSLFCFEAYAGLFRLLMKGIFDPYVLCDLLAKSLFLNLYRALKLVTLWQRVSF